MKEKTHAVILTKVYDILLWIIPQLEKFPRSQRFLLGEKIERLLLDVLDLIIRAVYTKDKTGPLAEANLTLERLRFLIRLSKDLHYISLKKYEFLARSINEAGQMTGGWLKYAGKKAGT